MCCCLGEVQFQNAEGVCKNPLLEEQSLKVTGTELTHKEQGMHFSHFSVWHLEFLSPKV